MSKFNKKDFMDSKNKKQVLKLRFGKIELLPLNEKRMGNFLEKLNEMNQAGKMVFDTETGESKTSFEYSDLVDMFYLLTNLGEIFTRDEILEILSEPNDDVLECQDYIINEYWAYIIESLDKTIKTTVDMSKEEVEKMVSESNTNGNNIDVNEFQEGVEAIKKANKKIELEAKKKELEQQLKELEG